MTALALSPLLAKEIRALTPIFAGTAAFVLACGMIGTPAVLLLGVAVYAVGVMTLGSLAVGHEYAYGTLGQALAEPGARVVLRRGKLGTLAGFLLVLALIATFCLSGVEDTLSPDDSAPGRSLWHVTALVLPPLLGFGVAPWVSMKCESPLAAAIFTLTAYSLFWTCAQTLVPLIPASSGWVGSAPALMSVAAIAVAGATGLAGWHSFMGLESAGRSRATARLAARPASRFAARGLAAPGPLRALLSKELHLQQLTLAVAALYVVGWTLVNFTSGGSPAIRAAFGGITLLYSMLIATLAGAVASAEERGIGTLPLQTLQPCAVRTQWTIKVVVVLAVALVLGGVVPSVLDSVRPFGSGSTWLGVQMLAFRGGYSAARLNTVTFGPLGLLAVLGVCALYVSSACRAGPHAWIGSFFFAAAALNSSAFVSRASSDLLFARLGIRTLLEPFGRWAATQDPALARYVDAIATNWWWRHQLDITIAVHGVLTVAWLAPLIVLGLRNHRYVPVERGALVAQLGQFAGWTLLCGIGAGAVSPLLQWAVLTLARP